MSMSSSNVEEGGREGVGDGEAGEDEEEVTEGRCDVLVVEVVRREKVLPG